MAKIVAVCKSEKKGTVKENIGEGRFEVNFGLVDDAHADCCTHRQVSLLDMSSIEKMRNLGLKIKPGDFAENLTTEGIELVLLPVGTQLNAGKEVVLEVTQIGKECHAGCAIFKQVGKCIMPKEGVFARVLHGGVVKTGDEIKVKKTKSKDNEN
jgi:MOSC domain-containing protein YiiM